MNEKKTVTLIFPGQGSQYVGMEKNIPIPLLKEADDILRFSLSKTMREGPTEKLTLTANAQPAILLHSVALFLDIKSILEKNDVTIERVLGHSVGEYAALVAARALDFQNALRAVHWRGTFMQEATPAGTGTMMAILNVPEETVHQACQESSFEDNRVAPANYNSPSQIVISGHTQACQRVIQWLEKYHKSPFRSIELNVSAPFHSSLMAPAAEKLKEKFHQLTFHSTQLPYIANIDATEYPMNTLGNLVKENLLKQVTDPVLWHQSMKKIPSNTLCLECGPGRTLMGLTRKIDRTLTVIPLDHEDAHKKCKEILS